MTRERRPATAVDVPAIQALVAGAYLKYAPRIGREPGPMQDDYAALVARGAVQVIDHSGTIEAVLVLIAKEDHLLLDNVAVAPAAQGAGLGRQLVGVAEETARRMGYAALRLYTHETMVENIDFYQRLGFAETHRVTERGFNRVYMSKRIG